ncbi:hypothetical protein LTR56_026058 [Elasticomyces elasticus]|nr:hypothetical protein LTR22_027906 [Elasticomyces elasticus]KAK3616283.1 hypothetical protein LTR56_026058 [Elasticomyces elasticus]KAK4905349.1 hypothetical protein LTR49_025334 [Elasticomyces elasticus]KAK5739096.1 hypothetical protein LTS12_025404 [Elasticomyces elasticus]
MDVQEKYGSYGMEAKGQTWLRSREFAAFWALALGLLITAIRSAIVVSGVPLSFAYMRSLGLGRPFIDDAVSQDWYQATPLGESNLSSLAAKVLAANLPQLLLSVVYMLYNDLFTRMQLAREWLSYSKTRKSLRVTNPEGEQRSTRFLQLPFIYAIPLLIAMAVLHWLVSQSVFVVLANTYDYSNGGPAQDMGLDVIGVGFSPYGIILALVVGGALILGLWLHALLLRYPRNMPLGGPVAWRSVLRAISPHGTVMQHGRR